MGPGVWLRWGWSLTLWCCRTARLLGSSHLGAGGILAVAMIFYSGDTTMNSVVNFKSVRKLFKKDHPPFVILHQQQLIFISKEAGEVLDVSNPAWPLIQSSDRSGIKRDALPVISSTSDNKQLDFIRFAPALSYSSQLILYFLQLNQTEAVSFLRWALRELMPFAASQKRAQAFTRSRAQLLGLETGERRSATRQVLVVPGGIEARIACRLSGLDEESITTKGGETCRKP